MIADLEAKRKALGEAIDRLKFVVDPRRRLGAQSQAVSDLAAQNYRSARS